MEPTCDSEAEREINSVQGNPVEDHIEKITADKCATQESDSCGTTVYVIDIDGQVMDTGNTKTENHTDTKKNTVEKSEFEIIKDISTHNINYEKEDKELISEKSTSLAVCNDISTNKDDTDDLININKDIKTVDDGADEFVSEQACFVCYKNRHDMNHIPHTQCPFICICNAFFEKIEELMNHKTSCKAHTLEIKKLKDYSCRVCKLLMKTNQRLVRHLKCSTHKKRTKELSKISNTAGQNNNKSRKGIESNSPKNKPDIKTTSFVQKANTVQSEYNTRKLPRKRDWTKTCQNDDGLRTGATKDRNNGTRKSQTEAEKLIEDIKSACTKLEKFGQNFLLIISDRTDYQVFGSEVAKEFACKKDKLIEDYVTFDTEKSSSLTQSEQLIEKRPLSGRKPKTLTRTVKVSEINAKLPKECKQSVSFIKEARLVLEKVKINKCASKTNGKPVKRAKGKAALEKKSNVAIDSNEKVANIHEKMDFETGVLADGLHDDSNTIVKEEDLELDDEFAPVDDDVGTDGNDSDSEYTPKLEPSIGNDDDVKSRNKARALFRKWTELKFGTAKHVVRESKNEDCKFEQANTDVDIHICQKCGIYFMNPLHLKTHQTRISLCDNWNYVIPQNSPDPLETFVTIQKTIGNGSAEVECKLKDLLESHKTPPHQCQVCKRKFLILSKLKEHYKCHGERPLYTCGICGSQVKSASGLNKHLVNHFNEPFDCEICTRRFSSQSQLESHKLTKCLLSHRTRDFTECEMELVPGELKCIKCGYQAPNLALLATHQMSHSDSKVIPCVVCQKEVKCEHMKRHIILMHQDSTPFECNICHKAYKDKVGLNRHTLIHTSGKFPCPICDKVFHVKEYLRGHMYVHNKVKKYICQYCGTAYMKKRYFENHVRIHTGERPFTCTFEGCGKGFRCKPNLEQHLRNHQNVGQFVCDICGKTFKHPGLLNSHRRGHTVEYRWSCTYCPEKFKSCWSYKRHLAKNHPEKKEEIERTTNIRLHKCTICDKIYHDMEDLRRHVNNHNGIKPFACAYCKKAFSDKSNLKAHEHSHKGTVKLGCKICYKSFLHERNLIAHTKRVHPESVIERQDNDGGSLHTYTGEDLNQEEVCITLDGLDTQGPELQIY